MRFFKRLFGKEQDGPAQLRMDDTTRIKNKLYNERVRIFSNSLSTIAHILFGSGVVGGATAFLTFVANSTQKISFNTGTPPEVLLSVQLSQNLAIISVVTGISCYFFFMALSMWVLKSLAPE